MKKNILQVGDMVCIKYDMVVCEYKEECHHFLCKVRTADEKYRHLIWFPAHTKYFNYVEHIKVEYVVPKNFNPHKTIDGIKYYAIFPKDFSETGDILWKAQGNAAFQMSHNFVSREGVIDNNVNNHWNKIIEYHASTLEQGTVKGVVHRLFKIRYNYEGDTTEELVRMESIDISKNTEDIFGHNSPITVVIGIDNYFELYVPHTIVEKLNETS